MKNIEIKELKVGTQTNPHSLAGSIVIEVSQNGRVELVSIGAGALNTATKAIAIARGNASTQGMDLWSYPVFTKVKVDKYDPNDGPDKVGMKLVVEDKS